MEGPGKTPTAPSPPLTPGIRLLLGVGVALFGLLAAGTLYLLAVRAGVALGLWGAGGRFVTGTYQFLLVAHGLLGVALVVPMTGVLALHLPLVWRRRSRATLVSGATLVLIGAGITYTGVEILARSSGRSPGWVWWLHVVMGAAVVAAYVHHRRASRRPPLVAGIVRLLGGAALAGAALFILDMGNGVHPPSPTVPEPEPGPLTAGSVAPESPFFPSPVRTVSGGMTSLDAVIPFPDRVAADSVRAEAEGSGFNRSVPIGAETCVGCHPDVTRQWAASSHRFSSFNNPFYEASVTPLRRSVKSNAWIDRHMESMGGRVQGAGRAKSKWCAGCHDPALLITGAMDGVLDRGDVAAQAGLTCLSCHAISRLHDRTGNGNYLLDDARETAYLFAGSDRGTAGRALHEALIKARPAAHKARFMRPLLQRSEFCATCHKVSLTEPLNDYRWLRGQNEFDAWQNSGVAWGAARTFYLPSAPRVCQDCHMPLEPAPEGDMASSGGMVRSHRFVAANTALPSLRGDDDTIRRIEEFLRADKLRVDVFAMTSGDERSMAIDRTGATVRPGQDVQFDVVVRNMGVGHTFPGGTNDSNQGWLEVSIRSESGRVLATSGRLDKNGHLDPLAHEFGALFVDEHGDPALHRNAQDFRAAVYANVVGPGSSKLAHYAFRVPRDVAGERITVTARLLWRKFNRRFSEFAFEENPRGFAPFSEAPALPITEVASDTVAVSVAESSVGGPPPRAGASSSQPADWIRFNDYGIALLSEGDLRGAYAAFAVVDTLEPGGVEGARNLARTATAQGSLETAYEHLRRAEGELPGDPRTAWVWGTALREDGRYEAAQAAFRRVVTAFPGDRSAWTELGRTLFLDNRLEGSLEAFASVLAIDPEDRIAHYYRMLALRGLGRNAEADIAARAYEAYNIDPVTRQLTREVRLGDPGANTLSQRVRVHTLGPPS